jgi:GNAT superfamily N-acetyltransferase
MSATLAFINTYLPAGFTARPATMDDAETVSDLINTYTRWERGENTALAETVRDDWSHSTFHLDTDTVAVFDPDGKMVAYAEFWDNSQLHIICFVYAIVHPHYQGIGLGSFLHEWQLARGAQSVEKAPADARVELRQSLIQVEKNESVAQFLARRGFEYVRTFYRMRIDFETSPQLPTALDGITIRAVQNDEELRSAVYTGYEAFRDHWGMMNETFEQFLARWLDHVSHNARHDPSLWFIALDGEEIAGISLCQAGIDDDPEMGWVNTLGVRRPWRKRGLGLVLLQHSFWALAQRGKPRVGLGVDAGSLTGATRLYERAGMRVEHSYDTYVYELRSGKNYTVQTVEE